ncbi:ribbon-helix-helix protein, CopG family [Ciceribacter sp. L1K23]|uniref:CopG family ribbon-helix-helix protein n=1 Tax=Ciceribacter sp. L1K23 TaxID=2820276 RepID=UPI001B83D0D4|nr:ribbon-helix-helix protein, CopG family [Ciceribacter sp. L1K23]MBR0555472.1 ribbon-helix-helix protein, CopG family [Ciceribacter sp. L1K23]
MNSITVRIPDETAARLDRLAEKLARPADSVAADAIEAFVAREEWRIEEIEAGINEADRGDFVSEDEVNAVFTRFGAKPLSA